MSKPKEKASEREMLEEYDFRAGVRGKYARRYAEGSNIVIVAPELAEVFPTSQAVNEALRKLLEQQDRQGKTEE